MPGIARQPFDQYGQIPPDQRLAAGDPQLGDAQLYRHAHEPLDLFETSADSRAVHELHALFRHAVEAADIAAVRDADPQIVVHARRTRRPADGWHVVT